MEVVAVFRPWHRVLPIVYRYCLHVDDLTDRSKLALDYMVCASKVDPANEYGFKKISRTSSSSIALLSSCQCVCSVPRAN